MFVKSLNLSFHWYFCTVNFSLDTRVKLVEYFVLSFFLFLSSSFSRSTKHLVFSPVYLRFLTTGRNFCFLVSTRKRRNVETFSFLFFRNYRKFWALVRIVVAYVRSLTRIGEREREGEEGGGISRVPIRATRVLDPRDNLGEESKFISFITDGASREFSGISGARRSA